MDRQSKRSAAQERLRGSFLCQVGPQLQEYAVLLSEDGDEASESVVAELNRIARTSSALGLEVLCAASEEASVAVSKGQGAVGLVAIARAIRSGSHTLFGPIGVVGDAVLAQRLRKAAPVTSEPIVVAETLDELEDPLSVVPWAALLVPMDQVETAREIAAEHNAPVLVWGEGRDWDTRLAVVKAGADGFVPHPVAVPDLLDRVRAHVRGRVGPAEVFFLAAETPERDAQVTFLEGAGFVVVVSGAPAEIAPALDLVCPDVLLLGAEVGGVSAEILLRAVRTHARRNHVPVLILGAKDNEAALREAGADDVFGETISPAKLCERVRLRYQRILAIRQGCHPVSNLLDRTATLRALDRMLGNTQRSGEPMSVCIFLIEGTQVARARWGKAASNMALRMVADGLNAGLRLKDLVGQVDGDTFLIGFQGCSERVARSRMVNVSRGIQLRLHGDHRLREVLCLFGLADTEVGLTGLVTRADEDLRSVRRTST
ncbi:MAG: diguanylate cyclase [Rhodobacterales bacterium]|nr:diguanylate cyclase [Rhodobacterales bacterium]